MECLLLRFDAPLMSFGGVRVDQHNPTDRFPGRAQLTGLLANALGWEHADRDSLNTLQARLEFAARWDVAPQALRDYQTADLGQQHLCEAGWTTRGVTEHREGGPAARTGTHERQRHYWAKGVLTLALTLTREGVPELADLESALRTPARPLFLGRKHCLPAGPICHGQRNATDLRSALAAEPADARAGDPPGLLEACWPASRNAERDDRRQLRSRTDDRDWWAQVHAGQRFMMEGLLHEVPPCT